MISTWPTRVRPTQPRRSRVVEAVTIRNWHERLVGFASHTTAPPARWRSDPSAGGASTKDVASAIAAYAVYTPPLLLWTRSPSMDWLRTDIALTLRCPWLEAAR